VLVCDHLGIKRVIHVQMTITSKSYIYSRTKALSTALGIKPKIFLTYQESTKYYWTLMYFKVRMESVERMLLRRQVTSRMLPELQERVFRYVGVPHIHDPRDWEKDWYLYGLPPLWFIGSPNLTSIWREELDCYITDASGGDWVDDGIELGSDSDSDSDGLDFSSTSGSGGSIVCVTSYVVGQ
jgi:hypothetical protein